MHGMHLVAFLFKLGFMYNEQSLSEFLHLLKYHSQILEVLLS